jgi:hypothetical protein
MVMGILRCSGDFSAFVRTCRDRRWNSGHDLRDRIRLLAGLNELPA